MNQPEKKPLLGFEPAPTAELEESREFQKSLERLMEESGVPLEDEGAPKRDPKDYPLPRLSLNRETGGVDVSPQSD